MFQIRNQTVFQTKEGVAVCTTTLEPGFRREYAIKRAIDKGFDTLFAVEPTGRRTDYTGILQDRKLKAA